MKKSKQTGKDIIFLLLAIVMLPCGVVLSCRSACAKPMKHEAKPIVLVHAGATRYVIALAGDAIPSEKTAAHELQEYVLKISGVTIPIENEAQVAENHPQILVGAGARARRLVPQVDWLSLGTDGIVIKSVGENLVLAGGRPRGALYAVDSFIEDALGVRWWAPDEVHIPSMREIRISSQDTTYVPQICYREVMASGVMDDPVLAVHLKINGYLEHQNQDWGGHYSILGFVHTIGKLLPIEKYFQAHPEWYSDPANENKPCTSASKMPGPNTWQLNLMDEGARRELTKNALDWIRADPDAGIISISQNDIAPECNTPEENAMAAREGSPSGPLLHFVNAVAADIEKQYPNFLVETLAYQYTVKPPLYEAPRHNVVIRLCSSNDVDFARPLDSNANSDFRDDMLAWKAIAPHLFIWDYTTNFSNGIFPHPNMNMLGPNVQFFAANKTIGLFEEGNSFSGGTGDFEAMRTWMLAHIMWDPRLNEKALETEFLNGYYGPAAPYLRDYIDSIQEAFLKSGGRLSLYQTDDSYLTLDVMNHASDDFHSAEKAVANNAVLTRRVRRERMALDHAWLLRYKVLRKDADTRKAVFKGPKDPIAFAHAFIKAAHEFNIRQEREGGNFDDYVPKLLNMVQPALPLPDFLHGIPSDDIVDVTPYLMSYFAGRAKTVDDPISPTGCAVEMPGNTDQWAIVYQPSKETSEQLATGKWHSYILARVDARDGAIPGRGLHYGIFDAKAGGVYAGWQTLQAFVPGKYSLLDLGVNHWNPDMYIWVTPPNRTDISEIYVGRMLLVRDEKAQ